MLDVERWALEVRYLMPFHGGGSILLPALGEGSKEFFLNGGFGASWKLPRLWWGDPNNLTS